MYWAGRKGWSFNQEDFQKLDWIADMKKDGLSFIIQDKTKLHYKIDLPVMVETDEFVIYQNP